MGPSTFRVLIVARSRRERERLISALGARPWTVEAVQGIRAAREVLRRGRTDLMIVEATRPGDAPHSLVRDAATACDAPAIVVVCHSPSVDAAVGAMRDGADDFLDGSTAGEALIERLEAAIARASRRREREAERLRLRKMCRKLGGVRREMFDQIGTMCDDLVTAYGELAGQIDVLDTLHEFQSLIRRELDVEALLRTVLEYLLAKAGPTNAAVFLPDSYGDFSLGAYVNYDCPRDTGEAMLDHLADVIPAAFGRQRDIAVMRCEAELGAMLGDEAHWLSGNGVVVLSCTAGEECLAVVTLFRDRRNPYEAKFLGTLGVVRDTFAEQLQRVIRIHHRHEPESGGEFGLDGGLDENEFDGPGDYGMAA